MPSRVIIVHATKKNPKFIELVEILKDKDLISKLKNEFIDISVNNEVPNDNMFKIDFYNFDMMLIQSFANAEPDIVIKEILMLAEKLGEPKQNAKVGGLRNKNYEHKYKKYKKKYNMIKQNND